MYSQVVSEVKVTHSVKVFNHVWGLVLETDAMRVFASVTWDRVVGYVTLASRTSSGGVDRTAKTSSSFDGLASCTNR